MARTLELTLASVLALMGGVYVLRSSRAEQARHQAELSAAVARRASLSAALLEARAALETERRWQGDERANLTRACLLYTSPSPRDATLSRMPSSA